METEGPPTPVEPSRGDCPASPHIPAHAPTFPPSSTQSRAEAPGCPVISAGPALGLVTSGALRRDPGSPLWLVAPGALAHLPMGWLLHEALPGSILGRCGAHHRCRRFLRKTRYRLGPRTPPPGSPWPCTHSSVQQLHMAQGLPVPFLCTKNAHTALKFC